MKVWDLHCDTLYRMRLAGKEGRLIDFHDNDLHLDLSRMKKGGYLLQCLACFVNLSEDADPLTACLELADLYEGILKQYPKEVARVTSPEDIRSLSSSGRIGLMLTAEEGGICLDNLSVLRTLYRLGVRMMTLTWNHRNGLAYPNIVPSDDPVWHCTPFTDHGLTPKGIEFIEEMERLHMILDVSHLSDGGFWDVVRIAKRPFAASHSNARAVCGHCRNLTDEMIRAMAERGGLIGLNFCDAFLDPSPDRSHLKSRISDMILHIRHLINIGGEDIMALGSDFDGIEGDMELTGAQDMPLLSDALLNAGFSERLVEKIFSGNAIRFFEENL